MKLLTRVRRWWHRRRHRDIADVQVERIRRRRAGLPADTPYARLIAWLHRVGRWPRRRRTPPLGDHFAGLGRPVEDSDSDAPLPPEPGRLARWQADREEERGYRIDRWTRW
jgi:hypothetical protein